MPNYKFLTGSPLTADLNTYEVQKLEHLVS